MTTSYHDNLADDRAQFSTDLLDQMRGILARGAAQRWSANATLDHLVVLLGPIVGKIWQQGHDEAVTAYQEICGQYACKPKENK